MDQIKIGKFIATMRKAQGMTQEALGGKLGVTNKTISRWETGAYMPDIDKLQELAATLNVTVNELLSGEKIESADTFAKKADENLVEILSESSAFGLRDRISFYKRKWLKEHKGYLAAWTAAWLAVCVLAVLLKQPVLCGAVFVLALLIYMHVRNRMMIYVEAKAFDGKGSKKG